MRFEGIPDAKGNQNTKVCFQHSAGIIRLLDFNSLNQLRPLIPNVVHRSENGVPCEMISRFRTICNYLIHLFSSNSLPHPFPGGFRYQDQRPALWGLAVCKYKINSVGWRGHNLLVLYIFTDFLILQHVIVAQFIVWHQKSTRCTSRWTTWRWRVAINEV